MSSARARQRRINNRMSCRRERVLVTGGLSSRNISEENATVSFGRFLRRCSRTGSATAAMAARKMEREMPWKINGCGCARPVRRGRGGRTNKCEARIPSGWSVGSRWWMMPSVSQSDLSPCWWALNFFKYPARALAGSAGMTRPDSRSSKFTELSKVKRDFRRVESSAATSCRARRRRVRRAGISIPPAASGNPKSRTSTRASGRG